MVFAGKTDTHSRAERWDGAQSWRMSAKIWSQTRAIMYINTESEPVVQDKGHGDIMYNMVTIVNNTVLLFECC